MSRHIVNSALAEHKLSVTSESSIRLNPFASALRVSNLELVNSEGAPFSLESLELNYRLLSLLKRQILISHMALSGFELQIEINGSDMIIAGIDLNSLSNDANHSPNISIEPPEEEKKTSPAEILVRAEHIEFKDLSVSIDYQGEQHEAHLDSLELKDLEIDQGSLKTSLAAKLALHGLNYQNKEIKAELEQYRLVLNDLKLNADVEDKISGELATRLKGLSVRFSETEDTLASLGQLELNKLFLEPQADGVTITSPLLQLEKIVFSHLKSEELAPLFALDQLDLIDLQASDKNASVSQIELGEIASYISLKDNQVANLLLPAQDKNSASELAIDQRASSDTQAESDHPGQESESETSPSTNLVDTSSNASVFPVSVGSIRSVTDSIFEIDDSTPKPAFRKKFRLRDLLITNIDSGDSNSETSYSAKLNDEQYMELDLSGKVQPFSEHVNASINPELKEFSLPEVNGYLSEALGFEFKAGQLDSEVSGNVIESQIDSTVKLTLRGSDFSASQAPDDEVNLIGQSAVPLNVALGMLKDKRGNITLNIPVRGDVEDPNFGFEYILALVVKKAVMRQTKNYLMTTFVPYAQVLNVAMSAGSFALKVRFEDLEFAPGQTEIFEAQETFVSQLSKLMKDKGSLQVKICPVATPVDLDLAAVADETQRDNLIQIANQRAELFKSAVVENGIDSSRLLLCAAKIEQSNDKAPRLKFSI